MRSPGLAGSCASSAAQTGEVVTRHPPVPGLIPTSPGLLLYRYEQVWPGAAE